MDLNKELNNNKTERIIERKRILGFGLSLYRERNVVVI